jgi:pyruvate dehydrogenase (quinone)
MGAHGIRLEEPSHVEDALREALAHAGGPVVVDALVDPYALAIPSHVPGHVARGFTLSAWRQLLDGNRKLVAEEMRHNLALGAEVIEERVL